MDREELCDSLIVWLGTFSLDHAPTKPDDCTDGVLMMRALHQIAPSFFNESWMAKLKLDVGNNWRLKVSNLKKVLKGILDFYSEVLGQQIHDFHMPDVQAIGEHADTAELGRLLQLILGCAVNCEEKQEYIQRIMGMEEVVQHSVMKAIQELMTKEAPSADSASELKKTLEDLNKAVGEKDELAQRCHELDLQVSALQEEKTVVEIENDRLNERLNQADNLEDPSTPAGRRYQLLQNQVEQLQEELYRLESMKDDYRIKVELQDKEILELHQKNDELNTVAEEARAVKDEMEILRYTSDKVAKYEASIESYKKKVEELSDLKGQIRILEEKNTTYMEKNMELEEEVRKAGTVKSQLDMYKRQVQELQIKYADETKRADKSEFDAKRQQEKLQSMVMEKQRLAEERDSLKEAIDNLEGTRAQQGVLGDGGGGLDDAGMFDLMNVPPEVKEKLIRLQHENKMLKLKQSENDDENSQILQTMLEDANSRKNELESENRINNQRIMELQAQIEDLQENKQNAEESTSNELVKKVKELSEKLKIADNELEQRQSVSEEQETQAENNSKRVASLEEELRKKEDEMKVMEEKYKRYLEKARSVSKSDGEWGDNVLDEVFVQHIGGELSGVEREHIQGAGDREVTDSLGEGEKGVSYMDTQGDFGNKCKLLELQVVELQSALKVKESKIRILMKSSEPKVEYCDKSLQFCLDVRNVGVQTVDELVEETALQIMYIDVRNELLASKAELENAQEALASLSRKQCIDKNIQVDINNNGTQLLERKLKILGEENQTLKSEQ